MGTYSAAASETAFFHSAWCLKVSSKSLRVPSTRSFGLRSGSPRYGRLTLCVPSHPSESTRVVFGV